MSPEHLGHRGFGYLVLFLSAIVAVAAVMLSVSPSQAQSDGCQFLVTVRNPNAPIDFTGPAGGSNFALSDTSRNPAEIVLTNIYGSESCGWTLTPSQDWVSLNHSSGTLGPGEEFTVTVSVNNRASHLARGRHEAQIAIRSPQAARKTKGGRTVIHYKQSVDVVLFAQLPCDLTVSGGSYSARAEHGGVPQLYSVAKLSNAGDAPCDWQAHSDRPWLSVSPASGTIPGKGVGGFRIRANSGAAQLVPGDYDATVTLSWSETGPEVLGIEAVLEIDAPPCELHFAGGQRFEVRGKAGGMEFTPTHQKFVLENRGGTPCYYWQANGVPDWLEIVDEDTIHAQSQTDVLVRVNQDAAARLRPDVYPRKVSFSSGNVLASNGLDVSINVEPRPCHLEIEIEEDELYFRIEPEGLLESESEKPVTLHNHWTNKACQWSAESRRDWLDAEPASGTLAGGAKATVVAEIIKNTEDFVRLDSGQHKDNLGFTVAEGTADDPVSVTLDIPCNPTRPCAYLHTTHTQTHVNEPAEISLTIYNPLSKPISAQLYAQVPSGWEIDSESFTARCIGICNQNYIVAKGEQEPIVLHAIPNNAGVFEFVANVSWEEYRDESSTDSAPPEQGETQSLKAEVEVIDPNAVVRANAGASGGTPAGAAPESASQSTTASPAISGLAGEQQPSQAAQSQSLTAESEPVGSTPETAPITSPNAPLQQPAGGVGEERIVVQQVGLPPIVWVLASVIAVLLVIAIIVPLLRRRRRAPTVQVDYEELARQINRQRRGPQA